jgi:hypothetical protein
VGFKRWWVLKSKIFVKESKYLKDFFLNSVDECSSKFVHDFRNKLFLKLYLSKNVLTKVGDLNGYIFFNEKFFWKDLDNF